jgi:predicted RNA-binding Zn-ribbon protein involved in translation (DUF1610 family)
MDEHCPECGNEIYKPFDYCNACGWERKDKKVKKEEIDEDEDLEEWEELDDDEDYDKHDEYDEYDEGEEDEEDEEEEFDDYPKRKKRKPGRLTEKEMKKKKKREKERETDIKPLKITCKCGGIIKITSPKRPLKFKCPDCGKKGMLKGTEKIKTEPKTKFDKRRSTPKSGKPSPKRGEKPGKKPGGKPGRKPGKKPGKKPGRRHDIGRGKDFDKGYEKGTRKRSHKSRVGELENEEDEELGMELEQELGQKKEKFEDFAGFKIKHRVRKSKNSKSDKAKKVEPEFESDITIDKTPAKGKRPTKGQQRPKTPPENIKHTKHAKGGRGKRKRPKYEPPKDAHVVKPVKGRCSSCGSRNLRFFDDGSGRCADCGKGFSFGGDSSRILKKEYHCKRCKEPLDFIDEYDRWYCYSCNEYA